MSLIEQLGGYDFVKKMWIDGGSLRGTQLEFELLEHRRAHNMFEEGDFIVIPYTNYRSDVFNLTKLLKKTYDEKGIAYRHATDAEIAAGRRL
jgi:hypothetical protein